MLISVSVGENMPKFRNTLVLEYGCELIDEDEFILLYDVNK